MLRKESHPLIVELPYLDLALEHGAELYPEVCTSESECWVEVADEDLAAIEDHMEWIFGW